MNPSGGEAPRRIRRLEEAVVNRIAAGEVIQRPASALKELMENSLDAGATSLNIVVKDGGLKMIQITDNGHGIQVEDLPLLCERHTTSKLHEYDDLQSISTMGFRGEALASMSFVSHLSVTTMTAGQPHGYRASYKDGKMEGPARPCAAVQGTQIMVEDLFYNVAARRKAFKNPSDEYARMLDVVARFAVHWRDASFSVKKHGESRGDIHTSPCASVSDSVGAVYGPSVARELLPLTARSKAGEEAVFECEGMVSSANYSSKKATFILFMNHRLVECSALKRALEALYATLLPKASKPFLLLSLTLPPADLDVNVHPTKREVSFLHQETLVGAIADAVEEMLQESNTSRTFYTQTLLPGTQEAPTPPLQTQPQPQPQPQTQTQSRVVRVDATQPQGSLHAYMPPAATGNSELGATRKAVRQRRNPAESAELSSVRELIAAVEQQTHSGLQAILQNCSFVGMADDTRALVQHQTRLYLADVTALSTEVVYQQVLRRFAHFATMRLSTPAPLSQLVQLALEDEEQAGRWCPDDGSQEEIGRLNTALLVCKAEMLREYFGVEVSADGALTALPLILDHYTPDLDRLPGFVLALGNNVEWGSEKECFDSVAAALADLYAMHPPLLPKGGTRLPITPDSQTLRFSDSHGWMADGGWLAEGEVAWAQREWTIQHLLFPALKFFLIAPKSMATNGTIVQVASLEKLYKVFERC